MNTKQRGKGWRGIDFAVRTRPAIGSALAIFAHTFSEWTLRPGTLPAPDPDLLGRLAR